MDPSKRIRKILEYTGLNAKSFSEKIGLDRPQAIYDIQNNKTKSVSVQMQTKISSVFPEINKVWLITGEGEMLNTTPTRQVVAIGPNGEVYSPSLHKEPSKIKLKKSLLAGARGNLRGESLNPIATLKVGDLTPPPTKSYTHGVPYYNVDFIGGFDLVMNDQSINPEYLIDFQKYNEATCWCNVTGHSMEPLISNGDIIALKRIEDFRFLPLGEVYAIVTTNDMRTIKRIGPASDPSTYMLIPENKSPEYGEQELPKDMVRAVYLVLGCMKKL